MMKKLMTVCAVVLCAVGAFADPGVFKGTQATVWAQTVYTNVAAVGGENSYKQVEKITIQNNGLSSSSTVVAMEDCGAFTTIATVVAGAGAVATAYPIRIAADGVTTNLVSFPANKLRLVTTMASTNLATTVLWSVYGK